MSEYLYVIPGNNPTHNAIRADATNGEVNITISGPNLIAESDGTGHRATFTADDAALLDDLIKTLTKARKYI